MNKKEILALSKAELDEKYKRLRTDGLKDTNHNCENCENCEHCEHCDFCDTCDTCKNCDFVYFCERCDFCEYCYACKGLISKQYHILNTEFTKEEFEKFMHRLEREEIKNE